MQAQHLTYANMWFSHSPSPGQCNTHTLLIRSPSKINFCNRFLPNRYTNSHTSYTEEEGWGKLLEVIWFDCSQRSRERGREWVVVETISFLSEMIKKRAYGPSKESEVIIRLIPLGWEGRAYRMIRIPKGGLYVISFDFEAVSDLTRYYYYYYYYVYSHSPSVTVLPERNKGIRDAHSLMQAYPSTWLGLHQEY
jgi:hypothetical protein